MAMLEPFVSKSLMGPVCGSIKRKELSTALCSDLERKPVKRNKEVDITNLHVGKGFSALWNKVLPNN